jgi:acetyl-CoA carboxylase biotin carboxyl carrier protein
LPRTPATARKPSENQTQDFKQVARFLRSFIGRSQQHIKKYKEVRAMAQLTSPMAGKIQEINIKAGQMVTEDDELFIIEAMKMENVVYGDPGVVKEILVKVGDRVEEDDPLAVIE